MVYGAPGQYMVTALVLLAAVTIDATSHRGPLRRYLTFCAGRARVPP